MRSWDERSAELEAQARALYDRCKDGSAPGAMIAMVELRNLVPDLLDAVAGMRQQASGAAMAGRPDGDVALDLTTRRRVNAMRKADAFVAQSREAVQHGTSQAWILALMELREALAQLPPDPVA